ncbi:MAG: hypothetical protein FJX57_22035 [Alphaproteobacteria bacterium]|nr:hypothetical protein [Alphaproteobacteria bacterium]
MTPNIAWSVEQVAQAGMRIIGVIDTKESSAIAVAIAGPQHVHNDDGDTVMLVVIGQEGDGRVPVLDLRVEDGRVPSQHGLEAARAIDAWTNADGRTQGLPAPRRMRAGASRHWPHCDRTGIAGPRFSSGVNDAAAAMRTNRLTRSHRRPAQAAG